LNGKTPCAAINVILNPSLDLTNLKDVQKQFDDGKSPVVLWNCGVERMGFFDKMSMGGGTYIESYVPIYVLKNVGGNGFLYKSSLESKWQSIAVLSDRTTTPYLKTIEEASSRPKYLDVENNLKAAITQNINELKKEADEAKELNKLQKSWT